MTHTDWRLLNEIADKHPGALAQLERYVVSQRTTTLELWSERFRLSLELHFPNFDSPVTRELWQGARNMISSQRRTAELLARVREEVIQLISEAEHTANPPETVKLLYSAEEIIRSMTDELVASQVVAILRTYNIDTPPLSYEMTTI